MLVYIKSKLHDNEISKSEIKHLLIYIYRMNFISFLDFDRMNFKAELLLDGIIY